MQIATTMGIRLTKHNEKIDVVPHDLLYFLKKLGVTPILINNIINTVPETDGLILSGGSDVDDMRKRTEFEFIDWAITNRKPILGICHGLQSLCQYYGSDITAVTGHVGVLHDTTNNFKVNSYHDYGVVSCPSELGVLSRVGDVIEAVEGDNILGVQWHPERPGNNRAANELVSKWINKHLL